MAGGEGNVVAKIAVRVVPNTKGFRQNTKFQVERELKGLKFKVRVVADTKGFAKDVNNAASKAAKSASGKNVKFDSDLEAAGLGAKAKAAAAAVSGNKIKFGVDIDRRGLRGLANSISTGFRSVEIGSRSQTIERITKQIQNVNRGLAKLRVTGLRSFQSIDQGAKGFGRSIKQATVPVRTLGKTLLSLPGRSELLRAYGGDLNDHIFQPLNEKVQRQRLKQLRKQIDAEIQLFGKLANTQSRLRSAKSARATDPVAIWAKAHKDMVALSKRLNNGGFADVPVKHLQQLFRQLRTEVHEGGKEFNRFQAQLDKVNQRFQLDKKIRKTSEAMRDLGHQFRTTPIGWQMERALWRVNIEAAGVRDQIEKVGRSQAWARMARGAQTAAKNLRNINVTSGVRTRGAWIPNMGADAKKADTGFRGLFNSIRKVGKSLRGAGKDSDGFFKKFRQKYFQPDQTIGFVIAGVAAAIAPVAGLVGSLLAGLPTLLASVGAAAAVVALGFEGIKDAVEPLARALDPLKESLSGIFRESLTPQFEKLAEVIPAITPGLEGIANALTTFSGAFVDAFTSTANVDKLNGLLENTAGLFSAMAPGIASFTDGFLTMFEGASRGFPAMAEVFNNFAEMFSADMTMLVDTGQMQAAMESLATVTGSLFEGLHKIFVAGIEELPEMEEGFLALFDGISEGLVKAMPALASFSNAVGKGIGSLIDHIGSVLEATGPGLERMFSSMGNMFSSFMENVGPKLVDVAGRLSNSLASVFEELEPVFERLSPKIGEIVEKLGTGFADAIDNLVSSGALTTLVENLTELADAGTDMFLSFLEAAIPLLPKITENLTEFANVLAGGLAEELTTLAVDGMPQFVAGLEAVVEVLNKVVEVMNTLGNLPGMEGALGGIFGGLLSGKGVSGAIGGAFSGFTTDLFNLGKEAEEAAPKVSNLDTRLSEINARMAESTVKPNWAPALQAASDEAQVPLLNFSNSIDTSVWDGVSSATEALNTLPGVAAGAAEGAMSGIQSGMGSLGSVMSGVASVAVSDVSSSLAPLPGIASAAGNDAVASASSSLAPLPGIVQGAADEMTSAADTGMTQLNTAFQTGVDTSGEIAGTLVPTVKGAIGDTNALFSSGLALGHSFASGIRASIPEAAAAAAALAGAVKANMPNSPAKEGPLSGKGYTDESGKALARDFAGGIRSEVGTVSEAARDIAAAAKQGVEQYQKSLDTFHHDSLVDPIMEANAKKIHDYHKREAEAMERGSQDAEKAAADALDRRNKLLESLEVPDFREINRSIQSYYIDGTKGMFNQAILKHANDTQFSNQLRDVAMQAVREAREIFGDHPVMAEVEANVNAEHFKWSIDEAIKAADLGAVPIDFAIANLDQLKSDLGFGNGAVTRGLQAMLDFNPNETDAYRYEKGKEEIHYHVTDLEEAMRMEDERRRRGALRYI